MELKPCPFCGSEDLRRYKPNSSIPEYVHCEVCGGMNGADFWNARATDPLLREMAEALQGMADIYYGRDNQPIAGAFAKRMDDVLKKYYGQEAASEG